MKPTLQDNRIFLNKLLLVVGLTLLRMPIIFGLNDNPWIILSTSLPFWLVIVNNQFPELPLPISFPRATNRLIIISSVVTIIFGMFLVISFGFTYILALNAQKYTFLVVIGLALLASIVFIFGLKIINKGSVVDKKLLIIGIIFYLILMVGIIRASTDIPFLLIRLFLLITILFFSFSSKIILSKNAQLFIWHMYLGLLFYLGVNIILYLIGVNNPNVLNIKTGSSIILSLVGIKSARIYFPLSEGINQFGFAGGAGFVISVSILMENVYKKRTENFQYFINIIGLVMSGFVILATDSRGAMLHTILVSGIMVFNKLSHNRIFFTIIMFCQSLLLLPINKIASSVPVISMLTRGNTNFLNNRDFIWREGIEFLSKFKWAHIFGYGLIGQEKTGVVYHYWYTVENYINKTNINTNISLHHFGLQTIFDFGYIGLLASYSFFLLLGFRIISILQQEISDTKMLSIYALVIFFVLAGTTEAIPTVYSGELFYFVPFIWATLVFFDEDNKE